MKATSSLAPFAALSFAAFAGLWGCGGSFTPSAGDGGVLTDAAGTDAPPQGPDAGPVTACTGPAQCSLVTATCCGLCSRPKAKDYLALVAGESATFLADRCKDSGGCPKCAQQTGLGDGSIVATCRGGRCEVVDVREDTIGACRVDADCSVRTKACCECNAPTGDTELVAVSDPNAYARLVCAANSACPDCLPRYPADIRAVCINGRCELKR